MKKLFEPVCIGTMRLKNRIVMPAIATNLANENNVNDRLINYYVDRAIGGAGLIITEASCIDFPAGLSLPNQLRIDNDESVQGMKRLSDAVHLHGSRIALQLNHAGRAADSSITGKRHVAPSSIPYPSCGVPQALTIEEINILVEKFAEGVKRAKDAGFDGIELLCGSRYLIAQFLSPWSNKRVDEYGGNLNARAKFLLEILSRIREKVGKDYPIICKINGDEFIEGGLTQEQCTKIAEMLEIAGANALEVTVPGTPPTLEILTRRFVAPVTPMDVPRGYFVYLAEAVRKVVNIPVIIAGRIDPELAERILEEGKADLIAMGRSLLADPGLPRKAMEGRLGDIRPCIACQRCHHAIWQKLPITCTVNPLVGREKDLAIRPAKTPKRIVVVGGGPGGLEAAMIAALRGHEAILCEKRNELGGQSLYAAIPPGASEIRNIIEYYARQLKKLNVRIETNKKVTPEIVRKMHPDAVIVATGAKPVIPKIPGVDRENVATAVDVLTGKARVGDKIAVIGGGLVGVETALYLKEKMKKVTIIEMLEDIAMDEPRNSRFHFLKRLRDEGVEILTKTMVVEILEKGIIVNSNWFTKKQVIEADTVVLSVGAEPEDQLVEKLTNKIRELHSIGDCKEPRRILDAIHEGFEVASKI